MSFTTHYDVLIDAWAGSVQVGQTEVNIAYVEGVMKVVNFKDNGTYELHDLDVLLKGIDLASFEIIESHRKSE